METLVTRCIDPEPGLRTIAEHLGKGDSCCNLDETLDLVQGLSMGRIANAEAIKRKSTVSILVSRDADVRVGIVIV